MTFPADARPVCEFCFKTENVRLVSSHDLPWAARAGPYESRLLCVDCQERVKQVKR